MALELGIGVNGNVIRLFNRLCCQIVDFTDATELSELYFAFHKELSPSYFPASSHHHLAAKSK